MWELSIKNTHVSAGAGHSLHSQLCFKYLTVYLKNIDNLQSKIEEENKKSCTFAPVLLNDRTYPKDKRNLEQFLKDQSGHLKQIENNEKILLDKLDKKEKEQAYHNPKIDPNSEKLALEFKQKHDENEKDPGLRLYKKRNQKQQKLIKEDLEKENLDKDHKIETLGKKIKAD